MMNVGDEFWLVYTHPSRVDGPSRRHVRMIADEGLGDFAVHDLDTDEEWSVLKAELLRGDVQVQVIVSEECLEIATPDEFDAMTEGIELDVSDMTVVPDYASMTMQGLREEFNRVKAVLADAGHMFVQHTEEEKDLRAQYDGLLMEIRTRMMR